MGKKQAQMAWTVMTVVVLLLLSAFGYYTYTGTVVHEDQGGNAKGQIRPFIRVEELTTDGKRTVTAYLSIVNDGTTRLKLVDTAAMAPLYDVKLRVKAEGSDVTDFVQPSAAHMSAMRSGSSGKTVFDPENDSVVNLVPGSGLVRPIPLHSLFDMSREGHYELTLSYLPDTVTKSSSDIALAGAFSQRVICSYGFDLPMKKKDPAPKAPVKALTPDAPKTTPEKPATPQAPPPKAE